MSFPQPPTPPSEPFNTEPNNPANPQSPPVPQQEAWGQGPGPTTQPAPTTKKPISKALFSAFGVGLFLSGCVSGCISGAAIIQSNQKASPAPTATVTVTAKATEKVKEQSDNPTPSESTPTTPPSGTPTEAGSTPAAPPAPEAPTPAAPPAPDPNALTQPVEHGTITITPFTTRMDELTGKRALLCTTVTAVNTSQQTWSVNPLEFELSSPDHKRANASIFTGGQGLGHAELIAGDTVAGDVCFEDPGQRGQFTLIWGPFFAESTRWTVQIP